MINHSLLGLIHTDRGRMLSLHGGYKERGRGKGLAAYDLD